MKSDEVDFLVAVSERVKDGFTVRALISEESFSMHPKRARYLLKKWSGKDWYEYGVSQDLGWLTKKGQQIAQESSFWRDFNERYGISIEALTHNCPPLEPPSVEGKFRVCDYKKYHANKSLVAQHILVKKEKPENAFL